MFSSIQLSTGGLEAPAGPIGKATPEPGPIPNAFDQVMHRALAQDLDNPQSGSSNQQSKSKTVPQKSLSRATATASNPVSKTLSAVNAEDAQASNGSSTEPTGVSSTGKRRPLSPSPHRDSVSGFDPGQVQALPISGHPMELPFVPQLSDAKNLTDAQTCISGAGVPDQSVLDQAPQASTEDDDVVSGKETKPADESDATGRKLKDSAEPIAQRDSVQTGDKPTLEARTSDPAPANKSSLDSGRTDPPDIKTAFSDGPAPPGATGSEGAPREPTPGAAGAIQVKAPSQVGHSPPVAPPDNESFQGLGTSAAQQEPSMKKADKVLKNADLPQQNLPGEGALSAGHAQPVSAGQDSTTASIDLEKIGMVNSSSHVEKLAESGLPVSDAGNAPAAVDSRLASLERTHDLVAMHALRLSQSGSDSLRVVLEPGGGTRLSLDLRFSNAGIVADAQLHRGDFQYLNHHWAELQQRLEPQGVHLGALKCSDQLNSKQEGSQQPGHQTSDEQPNRSAFAEFALDGTMADSRGSRRDRTKTHQGWETWA
jgi:hypothetical protein